MPWKIPGRPVRLNNFAVAAVMRAGESNFKSDKKASKLSHTCNN